MRYVHTDDKAIAKSVRMVDGSVDQEVAALIVDNLVHFNRPAPVCGGLNVHWFDMGTEGKELACPICANFIFSMDVAALQTVCPLDLWMHA
jgi:hypothetical protein